jgi:hypothetical protein
MFVLQMKHLTLITMLHATHKHSQPVVRIEKLYFTFCEQIHDANSHWIAAQP